MGGRIEQVRDTTGAPWEFATHAELVRQIADYEAALSLVIPESYDCDEAFPAIVARWDADFVSHDPVRVARARGESDDPHAS